MTERLYYNDSYLTRFQARVLEVSGNKAYLDRTAFYPTSGGQPFDTGSIGEAAIVDVMEEEDRIAHVVEGHVEPGETGCTIDWDRRFDHMQQHSGQHLLSAVIVDAFRIPTLSFHLGGEVSTIDIETDSLAPRQIGQIEEGANRAVWENRPVTVSYHESGAGIGLRKPSGREGILRVITIEGLDRSACGGTHVRATGEIGPILIRKLDKIRGNVRIEFVCGLRALRRARADFEALGKIARGFTAPIDDTPGLVAAQAARLAEADKLRKKLSIELAGHRGRQLHAETAPNARGLRLAIRRGQAIDDELRAEAQSFTRCGSAMFLAADPACAILVAVSGDAGIRAGDALKPLLAGHGGRGGGNPQLAQGSVPDPGTVERVLAELAALAE